MVTIQDIARLSGVAKSTVSRYLNGGSVSETTKRKIEQVIQETGFIPNAFAQSLKAKKTNIIGTIVPRLDSYAATQTLIGIDEQLRELNCQMLIANTSQQIEREIESLYSLAKQKIAGIILLATYFTEEHVEAFRELQVPIILVGQELQGSHCVIHNDEEAGYEIGNYVLAKGHRNIVYLGVPEHDVAVGVKRKAGFKRALQGRTDCDVRYYETSFKIADAEAKTAEILAEFKPSIFVCATDNIALGVLKATYHKKDLHVPQDLSITGFGGYDLTELIHPSLTTVKFFYKEAGKLAAKNIVKLVNGENVEQVVLSQFEIMERESVDIWKQHHL